MVNEHNILADQWWRYEETATTLYSPISFTFEDPPATPPRSPSATLSIPRHKYNKS